MRAKFFELLSSLSSHDIDQETFIVSPVEALDGVISRVTITPTEQSNIYGARKVQYKRFDLSTVDPVALTYQGETFTHELVKRLTHVVVAKYRFHDRLDNSVIIPRFLHLSLQDITNDVLPGYFPQTKAVLLQAKPESDFFIGSLTVMVSP